MAHSASSHERDLRDYRNDFAGHHQPVPAWFLSWSLHAILFVVLAIAWRTVPSGVLSEPDRTMGIALVREGDDRRGYYHDTSLTTGHDVDSAPPSPEMPAEMLPSKAETTVDLSGFLPTAPERFSESEGSDAADVSGSLQGGSRSRGASGDVSTAVFGVVGVGTRFVYVFDRSGSMGGNEGRPIRAAKSELLASLNDLERIHQFQIVFYNEKPRVFNPTGGTPELVWGDEAGKQLAQRFVEDITAEGGTQHMEALSLALGMRPDVIFFLTDANEPQLSADELRRVRRLNRSASIHAIEFGYGAQRGHNNFLQQLARQNDGQHIYVDVARMRRQIE